MLGDVFTVSLSDLQPGADEVTLAIRVGYVLLEPLRIAPSLILVCSGRVH